MLTPVTVGEAGGFGGVGPGGGFGGAGVAGFGTVTTAVLLLEESTVDVALTVMFPFWFAPTVKRPLEFIEVPPLSPESDHLTVLSWLLVPMTEAVNCFVEPRLTVAEKGFILTPVTVGGFGGVGVGAGFGGAGVAGFGTVTTAVLLLELSAVDTALTVMFPL